MKVAGTPADLASAAVQAGGLVFVSAVSGLEATAGGASPDTETQTRTAISKLRAVLEAAGSSLGQLASVTVFLKRASDFDAMNAEYRKWFSEAPPVRTTVAANLPGGALMALSAIGLPAGAKREILLPAGWMKSPRPYSFIVRTDGLVFLA